MSLLDHYEVLGIPSTASFEEIKSAFRQAALRLHPDKSGGTGNETEFLKIQHAWDILSNPEKKAVYDLQRAAAMARAEVHITDTVLVENMESSRTDDGEAIVSWPCRCGGAYAVLEEELYSHQNDDTSSSSLLENKNEDQDQGDGRGEEEDEEDDKNSSSEVVVPCSTCSLHILVILKQHLSS